MTTKMKLEKCCTQIHVQLLACWERSISHTEHSSSSYELHKEKHMDALNMGCTLVLRQTLLSTDEIFFMLSCQGCHRSTYVLEDNSLFCFHTGLSLQESLPRVLDGFRGKDFTVWLKAELNVSNAIALRYFGGLDFKVKSKCSLSSHRIPRSRPHL